jgi:misacylated tRNA(Ala) deacylase
VTKLLYQTDSYLQTFDGTVMGFDDETSAVILDRSVFYPGGGGQPSDRGTLIANDQTYEVVKASKAGDDVLHFIEGSACPAVGSRVIGQIDWEHRYQLMRTHSAMHILCGVVWRDYGAQVTGGNMEPLLGRLDFEFESLTGDLIVEIEEKLNIEVAAAREVKVAILPREKAFQIPDLIRTKINLLPEGIEEVRTVEIVGLDLQADGGTHVRNISEVGKLHIKDYKSKGKINKRIYVEVQS